MRHVYAIALGSNRALSAGLTPPRLLESAMMALDAPPLRLLTRSPVIASAPIGPSRRRYANAAALVASDLPPPELLAHLKSLEHRFGRRRGGQRWASRTLDLDIVLWSGGRWKTPDLVVPHLRLADRTFVLVPLAVVAPRWRHPANGLETRHLLHRLNKRNRSTTA